MSLNPELLKMARVKLAIQIPGQEDPNQPPPGSDPSQGGDPSAGGMPPDPSQMPPGMPMDPSMQQGAPPTDPSAGAPPTSPDPMSGGGGMTADTVRQVVAEVMQQMSAQQGGPGGAGGKSNKADMQSNTSMDLFQIKKMLMTLFNSMGIPIPNELLLGGNRDVNTGLPAVGPGDPNSTSNPANTTSPQQPQSAIKPIGPMGSAFPGGQGAPPSSGSEKQSSLSIGEQISRPAKLARNKAAALGAVLRQKAKL